MLREIHFVYSEIAMVGREEGGGGVKGTLSPAHHAPFA